MVEKGVRELVDSIVSTAALITLSGAGLTQLLFDDVGGTGYVIGRLVLEGNFVSQVPLPAALPLLLGGLAGLGALGARRRRKAA